MHKEKRLIIDILLIASMITSIYFGFRSYYTINGIMDNQSMIGELYEQYLWNALLQLSFIVSTLLYCITLLMLHNMTVFDSKRKYKNIWSFVSISHIIVNLLLFLYLKGNSVEILNPIFVLLGGLSMLPMAPVIINTLTYLKELKKIN